MGLMDVRQKGLFLREQVEDGTKKCCVDCKTTKTPLWRAGPAGPKSLCNACGIRFRKRRISTNRGRDRKRERPHNSNNNGSTAMATVSATTSTCGTVATTSSGGSGDGEEDLGECMSLRMRLMMPFGEEVVMVQNLTSAVKKQRCHRPRKLGEEEEQAAVSLMALSCSSVYA